MLVKKFEKDPNDPKDIDLVYWRYWCQCLTPSHCLEIYQHGEDIEIGVHVFEQKGWWQRIKICWDILRGNGSRWTEVLLDKTDREELAAVIKGEVVS